MKVESEPVFGVEAPPLTTLRLRDGNDVLLVQVLPRVLSLTAQRYLKDLGKLLEASEGDLEAFWKRAERLKLTRLGVVDVDGVLGLWTDDANGAGTCGVVPELARPRWEKLSRLLRQ